MVTIFDSESLKQGAPGEKLIFDYHGEVNEEIIPYILEKIEHKVRDHGFEVSKARRLGKLCLEALQNIHEYYISLSDDARHFGAYLYIYEVGPVFQVLLANYLKADDKVRLFHELKQLNELHPTDRKERYLEMLSDEKWSESGGAGLGLIEMLWKSENSFKYEFEDIDPNYSIFILRLKVGRNPQSRDLEIESSPQSPYLRFSPIEENLVIRGRSIPENAVIFYTPLFEALSEFAKNPSGHLNVQICLDYINTSSSKCLLEVFKRLEQLPKEICLVDVNWCYEKGDDDMLEAGEDYELIVDLPFSFTELEEI